MVFPVWEPSLGEFLAGVLVARIWLTSRWFSRSAPTVWPDTRNNCPRSLRRKQSRMHGNYRNWTRWSTRRVRLTSACCGCARRHPLPPSATKTNTRIQIQWRIQDFLREGGNSLGGGRQSMILHNFCPDCMQMKRIGPEGGGVVVRGASLAPLRTSPLRPAREQDIVCIELEVTSQKSKKIKWKAVDDCPMKWPLKERFTVFEKSENIWWWPYKSPPGPACSAFNQTGSTSNQTSSSRNVGAVGVSNYCTEPTLYPTNGIMLCRPKFCLLSGFFKVRLLFGSSVVLHLPQTWVPWRSWRGPWTRAGWFRPRPCWSRWTTRGRTWGWSACMGS